MQSIDYVYRVSESGTVKINDDWQTGLASFPYGRADIRSSDINHPHPSGAVWHDIRKSWWPGNLGPTWQRSAWRCPATPSKAQRSAASHPSRCQSPTDHLKILYESMSRDIFSDNEAQFPQRTRAVKLLWFVRTVTTLGPMRRFRLVIRWPPELELHIHVLLTSNLSGCDPKTGLVCIVYSTQSRVSVVLVVQDELATAVNLPVSVSVRSYHTTAYPTA